MELVIIVALFVAVVVIVFAVRNPATERTHITLERGAINASLRR
jgi:hypothetical protein